MNQAILQASFLLKLWKKNRGFDSLEAVLIVLLKTFNTFQNVSLPTTNQSSSVENFVAILKLGI